MIEISNISKTVTGTPTEPVTVSQAKAFMHVDYSDDDTVITDMIVSAREDIERETNLALVDSSVSFDVELNELDAEDVAIVKLPYGSAATGSTVITDLNNDDAVVDTDDYTVRGNKIRLEVYGRMNVVYDVVPDVPTALKEAIMMLVAYRYNNRGDQDKQHGMPEDILRKISKYEEVWL